MLRRAGRRWMRSLGWILLFTFIITLTVGVYIRFYEPDKYVADYLLCAVPAQEGQKPAPLSMWMLLRDYNRILDEDSFRYQIVTQTMSDGSTFICARGSAADHMVTIRAAGRDAAIVTGLCNAVGDRLAAESVSLLGVASAETVHRAELHPQTGLVNDLLRMLGTMLAAFGILSLLAMLFGSRREPVCWNRSVVDLELPVLGQVPECEKTCEACTKELSRSAKKKKPSDCRLLTQVDRLVREGVDEAALAIRSRCGMQSSAIAVTGVRAEDEAPAVAVLLGQTLAEEGYSVLMMEMDGDRPSLRHYLGVAGQTGLVECIKDGSRLPYALLRTNTPNLHLIDCAHDGETIRKAASSAGCRTFVRNALTVYDYVIMSAPPASFGNCAAAVGSAADHTVIVAQDGRYTAKELSSIAAELRQRSAHVMGLVFSCVSKRRIKAVYHDDGKPYKKQGRENIRL